MSESSLKLTIAHLYPELLNIYGDWGNVLCLKKRAQWRNIDVEIVNINPNDEIDIKKTDLYFMGGGQDSQQIRVSEELQKNKMLLKEARDTDAVFLGICGGFQLFAHHYQPKEGQNLLGIGLLDCTTEAGDTRYIGNVVVETDFLTPKTLVGFENHSGLTTLYGDTKPLGLVKTGNGNNGKDKTEGARYKNVFGSYLHGSLLPKNPHFADYLIDLALKRRYGAQITLENLNDEIELKAHNCRLHAKY